MTKAELTEKLRYMNWYEMANLYEKAGLQVVEGVSATEMKIKLTETLKKD